MENCREQQTNGEFLTVDETLSEFRGRCSFRMYIPSKAAKFGIKIWSCVDAKSKYLHTAHVYLGKEDISSGTEVVTRLTRDLWDAGRTIVCDNYFTFPELGKTLWQHNTHLLGTVRPNRQGLPKDFVNEQLDVSEAQYVYRGQETLMKLQVQQRKSVLLYSTFHHDAAYNPQAKKPLIVSDYNETKCGVDQFDEMTKRCSYSPASRRWPIKVSTFIIYICVTLWFQIFAWLLEMAALNAWVLYQKQQKLNNADEGTRRVFLYSLSKQLREEQQEQRQRSDSYLNKGSQLMANIAEGLQKKALGEAKSVVLWCSAGQHTFRTDEVDECQV